MDSFNHKEIEIVHKTSKKDEKQNKPKRSKKIVLKRISVLRLRDHFGINLKNDIPYVIPHFGSRSMQMYGIASYRIYCYCYSDIFAILSVFFQTIQICIADI